MTTGNALVQAAMMHIGEKYVLGTTVPKDVDEWHGPWDCAEFVNYLVGKVHGAEFGKIGRRGDDAFTGYYTDDVRNGVPPVRQIPLRAARATIGALLLRRPPQVPNNAVFGHIGISDGYGKIVEAAGSKVGVVLGTVHGRTWDYGFVFDGVAYEDTKSLASIERMVITRSSSISIICRLQEALNRHSPIGLKLLEVDGDFGPKTTAAVCEFQRRAGLIADGIPGPETLHALKV